MSKPAPRPSIPPPVIVPAPPADPSTLDARGTVWPAGERFYRCYDVQWGSRDFYAGSAAHRGRFHPFTPAGASDPLGVLYGADDVDGALAESVFHDVPARGAAHVPFSKLLHRLVVALAPTRDLHLADLTSDGLRRLGLTREELIAADPRTYEHTAAWGRALHDHPAGFDGITWVSRLRDTSRCLVVFADRVDVLDLEVPDEFIPLTLAAGAGLDATCAAADHAGITIVGLAP